MTTVTMPAARSAGRRARLMVALLLTACAPHAPVSRPPVAEQPAAAPAGAREFRLLPGESEIRILAYRAGPLAALGHNHVISTTAIEGSVALADPVSQSAVSLSFPVQSLRVDIPAQRAEEGADFPGEMEQSAIDGTRANMLGPKLLDAEHYPAISLRSVAVAGELPELQLTVEILVRDRRTELTVPVRVGVGDGQLEATGSLSLQQTALGLEPFSVGFGALSVRDELLLRFRLRAREQP